MSRFLSKLAILIVRKKDHSCLPYIKEVAKILPQHDIYTEDNVLKQYEKNSIDIIISIGGDGTILHAARLFQHSKAPPILTFAKGTLGFMCVYKLSDLNTILTQMTNPFNVELKKRIRGKINGKTIYNALNDFFITKGNSMHVLCLDIYINDIFVTQARGDGLIISTPNGSTAYSLSAGGPIIQNKVPSILIVPICPLSLSFRPLVLPLDVKIGIQLNTYSRGEGIIISDGQEQHAFSRNDRLEITSSEFDVPMIVPENYQTQDWVIKLQKMLNWNSRFQQPRD